MGTTTPLKKINSTIVLFNEITIFRFMMYAIKMFLRVIYN